MAKITKAQKDELLAKAANVLEEVLHEYEELEKMETEEVADPTKMRKEEEAAKPEMQAEMPEASDDEKEEAEEQEDDDKDEDDKDEDKDDEQAEESDEELMRSFEAAKAKAEKRGLLKSEPKAEEKKTEEVKKTEEAPKAEPTEDLKKSIDSRFESLTKTVQQMAETIQKIAAQPAAPRKGVAGYAPLKKSEGEETLNKSEVIGKLLDLQKNGDRRVNAGLINRLETNRETAQDIEFVKGIVG